MIVKKEILIYVEEFLITGLNQVEQEYLKMRYDKNISGFQKPERVFNAELYHQLRKLQENIGSYNNLKIHPELVKNPFKLHLELIKNPSNNSRNILCIGDFVPKRISPDIVFHDGQNNLNNQLLVAELKMEGASVTNIIKDFQKLLFYKLSYLEFKNAVFIYTGLKSSLEEKLKLGLTNQMVECLITNNIVIALQEKQNNNPNWNIYEFKK
jgi:hypothetical protein